VLAKEKETSKVDPRIKRTRQLLMQAFGELMKEKRFQSITVQDIAERATVNRATFYAHFDDKYALLDYTIRESFRQQLATQMPNRPRYSSENLRLLILTLCEFMDAFHSHCMPADQQVLLLMETNITGELYDVLVAWLKDSGTERNSRGVPLEVAAVVTSWAMYGAAFQWSREKRPGSASEFVSQVLPMIVSGLSQSSRLPAP
jgi:AcrR family transcriptional regulator